MTPVLRGRQRERAVKLAGQAGWLHRQATGSTGDSVSKNTVESDRGKWDEPEVSVHTHRLRALAVFPASERLIAVHLLFLGYCDYGTAR